MKFPCPSCRKSMELPDSDGGMPVVCLACGHRFVAPAPAPAAPPVAPPIVQAPKPAPPMGSIVFRRIAITAFIAFVIVGVVFAAVMAGMALSDAEHPMTQATLAIKPSAPPHATSQRSRVTSQPAQESALPLIFSEFPATEPTTAPAEIASIPTSLPATPSLAPASPSVATRPSIKTVSMPSPSPTDAQIGHSIQRGVDYLLGQFNPRSHLLPEVDSQPNGYAMGEDILCVYALLQCGQAIDDPRLNYKEPLMKGLIDAMKALQLNNYRYETYSRGLRATALAVYDRPEDRLILTNDTLALVRGARAGAYTYGLQQRSGRGFAGRYSAWDNSNSQYGVLGVWSAAEAAREVPSSYWEAVRKHWEQTQSPNGQWDYYDSSRAGTHSMTCAGLASLFVAQDWLEPAKFTGNVGRSPFAPAVAKGLKWLEEENNCLDLDHGGYDLFSLERVGLACGFKYFGTHDWYRQLAKSVIAAQARDGSWGGRQIGINDWPPPRLTADFGPRVETAYDLLFLARGRHPILMNKLRFDGFWANRPRDVANLARFTARQLERPLNWQVVPLDHDWTDWTDSPILYLASHQPPKLSDQEIGKIRAFVENGGLLFTQADGGSPQFNAYVTEFAKKLFLNYEMSDLPENHPLYNTMFKLEPIAGLKIVSNGSRILMLHSTTDVSRYWELRDDKNKPIPFRFCTNLFIYAAGKRDLRNRLESNYIPPVNTSPTLTLPVARLSYAGNWDPEPAAWTRFSRYFQLNTGYKLDAKSLLISDLKPNSARIAILTGTARYDLTDAESAAIKTFVDAGGMLLIDMTGGTGAFDKGLESSLYFKVFPDAPPRRLWPDHPLLTATSSGMEDLSNPRLRLYAIDTLGAHGVFPQLIHHGHGHVLLTSLDITSGLLGTQTWGILGYDPDYAQSLLKNAILWTLDGQKD